MIKFIYGEDTFRLNEKLKNLKEEFFKKNTSNSILGVFDFAEGNFLNELKIKAKSQGLFSQKVLLVVKNIIAGKNKEIEADLLSFLEKFLEEKSDDVEIIFWENGKLAKNNKIFKFFLEKFSSEEFEILKGEALKKWIRNNFLDFDIKINPEIIDELAQGEAIDTSLINNEILKIVNYIGEDKENFNQEETKKLISARSEADIFRTIEFLSSGNKKMAMQTLHNQLDKGDDPFYILSMYIYQFRNLLKIGDFYFSGINNNFEIAKLTKLHPFVVQKGMGQLRNLNLEKLKKIYQTLEKIDIEAKTGKRDVKLGLEMLISEI